MTRDVLSARSIGVFDSGVGGLSVLRELRSLLPAEDFVYFADSAHNPYGGRTSEDIRRLTSGAVKWLWAQGTKATVVACNTASAFSLDLLRAQAGEAHPIIGLVPAIKPAVARTRSGVVGVLATPGTLRGTLLRDVTRQFAGPAGVHVVTAVSPLLVPLVEQGQAGSPAARAELRTVLAPVAEAGADTLVLGCTHFPFLRAAIEGEFPGQFELVDSGAAVARRTLRVLGERGTLRPDGQGRLRVFTSGRPEQVAPVVAQLLGEWAEVLQAAPLDVAL